VWQIYFFVKKELLKMQTLFCHVKLVISHVEKNIDVYT